MPYSIDPTAVPTRSSVAAIGPSDTELNDVSNAVTAKLLATAVPTNTSRDQRVTACGPQDVRRPLGPTERPAGDDGPATPRISRRLPHMPVARRRLSFPKLLHC